MYPKSMEALIESFLKIPGVGKKSAERFAYAIINKDKKDILAFSDSLIACANNIKKCNICGFLTENDTCELCSSTRRDHSTILVVEEPKDVIAIERCEKYKGTYHVLGGAISPINGIGPDELNIKSLIDRVDNGDIQELIVATSATIEGEATALYLSRIFTAKNINLTRIAYGMPVGSSLEYSDESTISRALDGRRKL